jgi:hypothetical protein
MRRFHFWATIVWLTVGAVACWLFRSSVAWVTALSWYAVVVSHGAGWAAGRAEDAAASDDEAG